jgi:hypothetical protein
MVYPRQETVLFREVPVASEEISDIQARAAKGKALREKIVNEWLAVVAAIHHEVFSLIDDFNKVPGYNGPQLKRPHLTGVTDARFYQPSFGLRVDGPRTSQAWDLVILDATRLVVITCAIGDGEPQRTTGAPRFNEDYDLVIDEIVNGGPTREHKPRDFIFKTMKAFFDAVAGTTV